MPPQNPTGMADTDSLGFEAACETYVDQAMGWRDWLESLIERYPWPTVLFALGVGYVLARRMR
ncbi:MAG TPA: hypothetical protein VJR03_08645 [Nitrospira sp.]|nr:hypothetical protein [Nitrospira sp.]